MMRANKVSKQYGNQAVLKGVSLSVDPGEILGFVGPNGAGKSTFLKCLLGIARPDSGDISIHGTDAIQRSDEVRKWVGFAPGDVNLYNQMSAVDTCCFALQGRDSACMLYALELLELFQLPQDKAVRTFSHGMKRKLLLSCALATKAPLLLLDEPMEGLDPEARKLVESILLQKAQDGVAVLFSSHDLASVERISTSVAFISEGSILQCAPLETILSQAGKRLRLTLREPKQLEELPQDKSLLWSGGPLRWTLQASGPLEQTLSLLSTLPIASLRDASGGLEDVFQTLT